MKIQKGKSGGPDVSNATKASEAFTQDNVGNMKVTCTGNPGEVHRLKNDYVGYKSIGLQQTQNANPTFGWATPDGILHTNATGHGQQQVMNYDKSMNKPDTFPNLEDEDTIVLAIGADGKATTYTLNLGAKI